MIFLVDEVIEQLMEQGYKFDIEAWPVYPLGNFTQIIHAVNYALRASSIFPGIPAGDKFMHRNYQRDRILVFVMALGERDIVKVAAAFAAIYLGFPVPESVEESKERVRYALKSVGKSIPQGRVMVAFLPSEVTKSGAHFDLALLYGFLKGSSERLIVGEVALDGTVRATAQSVRVIAAAYNSGIKQFICPRLTCEVLKLMPDGDFFMVEHVAQLLNGESSNPIEDNSNAHTQNRLGLNDVKGSGIKRVAMIAAAGWHHVLML